MSALGYAVMAGSLLHAAVATISPNRLPVKDGAPVTLVTPQDFTNVTRGEELTQESQTTLRTHFSPSVVVGIVVMVIINLLALFGNLCVSVVIVKTPHLRSQLTYFFVLNLCFVDLLNALLVLPLATATFALDDWVFGSALCYTHGILTSIFMFVSILSLSVISVERYYSIRLPMHYAAHMTLRRTLAVLAYVWAQSAAVAFLPLLGWNSYEYRGRRAQCAYSWQADGYHRLYVVFASVLCFALPGAVMTVMYTAIFRVARKTANQVHPSQLSRNSTPHPPELPPACPPGLDVPGPSHGQDLNGGIRYDVQENPRDGISTISKSGSPLPPPTLLPEQPNKHSRSRTFMSKSYMINLNFLTSSTDGSNPVVSEAQSTAATTSRRQGGHWKAVKTLLLIMTIFMVLWAPFFVVSLHSVIHGRLAHAALLEPVVTWLGFSSYAINPFIYGWLNRSVREALGCLLDQIKASLFATSDSEPDWSTSEDFFQFLERTSTTRTLSVPHSKSNQGGRTPPIVEELETATLHAA